MASIEHHLVGKIPSAVRRFPARTCHSKDLSKTDIGINEVTRDISKAVVPFKLLINDFCKFRYEYEALSAAILV
jgi:hypothetical protein